MNPHQRVLAVLERQLVDRIPVDLWVTPEVAGALRERTGEEDPLRLRQALGVDKIVGVAPGYAGTLYDPNGRARRDPWGVPERAAPFLVGVYLPLLN